MMHGSDTGEDALPRFVRQATDAIWEQRGRSGAVRDLYAKDVVRRGPAGVLVGDAAAMREVLATAQEFPDREVLTEDVIWCREHGGQALASQRMLSRATHSGDGDFGTPTGKRIDWYGIAERVVDADKIIEEWVVTDTGGILRQLGHDPQAWVQSLLDDGPIELPPLAEQEMPGPYRGTGNNHPLGAALAETVDRMMATDFSAVEQCYDPGCVLVYPGGVRGHGVQDAERFWVALRAAFPDAKLTVHHQIGREDRFEPPRASLCWSLLGRHTGWGAFGAPSGAMVRILGLSQAEFGPRGIRREWTIYDETAIWAQILGSA